MKRIILYIILFLIPSHLLSQDLEGRVVEIKDGNEKPIAQANIVWEGTNIGSVSNDNGYYKIKFPDNYPSTLIATFVGYKTYKQKFNRQQIKRSVSYKIIMEASVDLEEVNIEGKINTNSLSIIDPVNVQTISIGELEKAACCNLSECFETNSTVDVSFTDAITGAKQIKMLGLDGIYTQITHENMPLISGPSSSFGLSYVPGSWIQSINIIKGTGSVINGYSALAGQIDVQYYNPSNSPKFLYNTHINKDGKIENNLILSKREGVWKSNLYAHLTYFNKEIDNHGDYHDHTDHSDHKGDNFMDMPKMKQINILNKWENKDNGPYNMTLAARLILDDRLGGQLSNIPIEDRYVYEMSNDIIDIFSKIGMPQAEKPGISMGLQSSYRRHNQNIILGDRNYDIFQENIYMNFIRQTFINTKDNILKYGVSYNSDRFIESLNGSNINNKFTDLTRKDDLYGIFSEYSFEDEFINIVIGLRSDYYNNTDNLYFLPRFNFKYNPTENSVIRLSSGKSFRISNIFTENLSYLISNRLIEVPDMNQLLPELAWNYGVNFAHCFYLNGREGQISFDVYRTDFQNQIIVDIEEEGVISFYNLEGESYANSFQVDFIYQLFNNLDMKMAYKINDIYTTFTSSTERVPLTPLDRALINIAYTTESDRLSIDLTSNYIGKSRLPSHSLLSAAYSDPFFIYNTQITTRFNNFEVYVGGENLLGYTQENPILDSNNPNSNLFDASLIYAPIMGRSLYLGLRYKI